MGNARLQAGTVLAGSLLAAGLAAGCARHAVDAAAPSGTSIAAHPEQSKPLHRFRAGDTWTFAADTSKKSDRTTITVTPETVKAPDGTTCMVFHMETRLAGGKKVVAEAPFQQDASGSEILKGTPGAAGKRFRWGVAPNGASVRLRSPVFPGENWFDVMNLDDRNTQLFQAMVGKPETVSVAAGKFQAFLVHEKVATLNTKENKTLSAHRDDVWMDPSIGFPVKQVIHRGKVSTLQELISYHLAGGASSS